MLIVNHGRLYIRRSLKTSYKGSKSKMRQLEMVTIEVTIFALVEKVTQL